MSALSTDALNILVATYYDDASRKPLKPKRRDDLKHGVRAMLDESGVSWRTIPTFNVEIASEALVDLSAWLRAVRTAKPRLKSTESRCRAAVRLRGINLPDGRGHPLLRDQWITLLAALRKKGSHSHGPVLPIAYWASGQGLDPWDIELSQLLKFSDYYHRTHCGGWVEKYLQRASAGWRKAVCLCGLPLDLPSPCGNRIRHNDNALNPTLLSQLDGLAVAWAAKSQQEDAK